MTTGSQSMVPPIDGYGMRGTFVLRTAEDAMAVRSYVQQNVCRNAVIAGGGLLGLEAAYGLHKMGVNTAVLERSATLLKRQLDKRGGQFLQEYLEGVGLNIVTEAETAGVRGNGHINQLVLKDGRTLPCDIFLVCVGIRSDMELAEQLGLEKKRGVIVNEFMQTSQPDIYAAGDVAEFDGKVFGLWPVAVSQAETAAINAIGDEKRYTEIVPSTMLKVVGVDLNSIGRIQAEGEKEFEIALEETDEHRYRKLVIAENKIVGAILLGYPRLSAGVSEAVKGEVDIAAHLDELKAGDWTALVKLAE